MEMNVIPDDIFHGIEEVFQEDLVTASRIFHFLSKNVSANTAAPYMRTLQKVLNNRKLFFLVAQRMAEDTKTAEEDAEYKEMMSVVWNALMTDSTEECRAAGQKWELVLKSYATKNVAAFCFMKAIGRLPLAKVKELFKAVGPLSGPVAVNGGKAAAILPFAKSVARVGIVAAFLAINVITNIRRWWRGEISGKRCVKNILDCGVGMAAGVTGGIGGEIIGAIAGSCLGPVGTVVGAIVGSVAGGVLASVTAESLCRRLTQRVFGIPKSVALENAYIFLGVPSKASNSDINSQYRRLALRYHPDKGGDVHNWTQLQYSLQVIKESRGEL